MSVKQYKNGQLENIAGGSAPDATLDADSVNSVQNKVIKAKFDEIEEKLAWKNADNVLQDGSIDLTDIDYNEISVEVYDATVNTRYQKVIPKCQISSSPSYFYIDGYYATNTSQASVRAIISTTNVKVDHYFLNGAQSSNFITLGVWYR